MLSELAHGVVEIGKGLFYAILWNLVLFNLGRLVLLVCTCGRYPRGRFLGLHVNRICGVGLLFLAVAWCGIAMHNNWPARVA